MIIFCYNSPINLHLYHYAGNNPIRYVDPDGRENFNFENFFKCQIEAFFLDIYSSGLEMLGCVENFFTNVENGNYEVDAGVALIHKGVEIKSYYINDNSSYDINDFSENLQCLACFPITLSSKGISFTQSKNILTSDVLSIGYTLSVRKPDLSKDLVRIGGTGFIDATLLGASINLGISAPVDNINNSLKIEAYSNYNKATTLKSPMRCFE